MQRRKHLSLVICLIALAASKPVQARFYWDGAPVFSTLERWEILLFGMILLALAGALIFILVKLINLFFSPK